MARAPLDLPELSDGVVRLRAFAAPDAPALVEIWRDPAIRARNAVPEPSEEAASEWIERSAARAAAGEAWEWAILDAATGALAGRRALKAIDWQRRQALAAAWVAPRSRGRRFAARSLRLAAAHAFSQGLERIQAECETDNEAALRSMLSVGMRHERTLTAHAVSNAGVAVDLHVLAMAPGDLAAVRWPPLPVREEKR